MNEHLEQQRIHEEAKRARCWDRKEQWRVLQETITWADAQNKPPCNSPQGCIARQKRQSVIPLR